MIRNNLSGFAPFVPSTRSETAAFAPAKAHPKAMDVEEFTEYLDASLRQFREKTQRWDFEGLVTFLDGIPKANLHQHITGSAGSPELLGMAIQIYQEDLAAREAFLEYVVSTSFMRPEIARHFFKFSSTAMLQWLQSHIPYRATPRDFNHEDVTYTGVLMSDLLEYAGMADTATNVHMVTLDEYAVDVSVADMKAGVADYLVKEGQIDHILLERSIRHSVERKTLEREHAALEEQLLQAQKLESVGQLAGGIAHDFNNLMTQIVGYASMGLTSLPEENRERLYLEEILKAAERATNLIQELLAFSRRQVIKMKVVNLNDLLVNINMMLERLIGEDVEMVILPSESIGSVKVDPAQIEQVIVNLAVNTRDAMPEGGTLIIETTNVEFHEKDLRNHPDMNAGRYVMIAVSDTGNGMSEGVQSHIFEPFYTTREKGRASVSQLAMASSPRTRATSGCTAR